MRSRDRFLAVALILALIVAAKLGQQLYRWYAFGEERIELSRVEVDLETAALGLIAAQLRADSLRLAIDGIDEDLVVARSALDRYERQSVGGALPPGLLGAYRGDLIAYNQRVAERNALFHDWRGTVDENHRYVDRYNLLADSIRTLASRLGEPYYPVPTPAEIAVRRGWGETGP